MISSPLILNPTFPPSLISPLHPPPHPHLLPLILTLSFSLLFLHVFSIARNQVLLKGTLHTQHSEGPTSRNLRIRKALEQLVDVVPIKTLPNVKTRHKDIDMVVIREQVEGEYSGLEHETVPGVVQSLKVATEQQTRKVATFALEYARKHGRKKVTVIHKANIMKMTDGMFLEVSRDVAKDYPDITFNDHIIDNCCMQLVAKPGQYEVLVTPNLYGNIVINVAAGIAGGPGIVPGANFGKRAAIFEPGTRHVGLDIAGKNSANPTAMILSSCLMLDHIGLTQYADKIKSALYEVYSDTTVRTKDLGGTATTREFTYEVIKRIKNSP